MVIVARRQPEPHTYNLLLLIEQYAALPAAFSQDDFVSARCRREVVLPIALPSHNQRFLVLDGLRGIAAIAVIIYHRREWSPNGHWFEHAHLAVDFFFLLSGFVIAHAYGQRLQGSMTVRAFFRARLVRLYPLILAGAILGAGYQLMAATAQHDALWLRDIKRSLPLALFLLPAPPGVGAAPFTINAPAWSLFFELLINLGYALIVRLLSTSILVLIIALSFVAEVAIAFHYGSLGPVGNEFGSLLSAVPRTMLPFFSGVLLYRLYACDRLPKVNAGLVSLSLVLLLSFVPVFLDRPQPLYDLACVCLLYPAIIVLGCQASLSGRAAKFATTLADLSFPIYILHYPLLSWFTFATRGLGLEDGKPEPWYLFIAVASVSIVSAAVLRFYDVPLRKWIVTRRERGTRAREDQSSAWARE